jgi:5-methyltetrahydrofolate--homocysteine methyltransferase
MEKLKIGEFLKRNIAIVDGAMGTSIESYGLKNDDFGGEKFHGCNEHLNITRPDVICEIHKSFILAGADFITTNTFGASPLGLAEYGIGDRAAEINEAAVKIARQAIEELDLKRPVYIAGDIGPTNHSLTLGKDRTFQEVSDSFAVQAEALILAGVDFLLLETQNDPLNLKAAIVAINQVKEKLNSQTPLAITTTIETNGTTLGGQTIEAVYYTVAGYKPLYLGLNCATGPKEMVSHIRALAKISCFPLAVVPNAGLPGADGHYHETPDDFVYFSRVV